MDFQPWVLWDWPGAIQVDAYQLGVASLVEPVLQVVVFDARDGSAIRARLLFVLHPSVLRSDRLHRLSTKCVRQVDQCHCHLPWFQE